MNGWAARDRVSRSVLAAVVGLGLIAQTASATAAEPTVSSPLAAATDSADVAGAAPDSADVAGPAPDVDRSVEGDADFATRGSPQGLPIRRVEILPRNIYDPLPPGRLRAVYRLANGLHLRTRVRTIRDQLLFAPGDPWSDALGRETARALRSLDILDPYRLEANRVGDSVDVRIETRDAWTTAPELTLESSGGEHFSAVSIIERNVLGLGKAVSLVYREAPEGLTRSIFYDDPNVLGSRLRLNATGATGTDGASHRLSARVPFYAEDTPFSYGVSWGLVTSLARLFQSGREMASFDRRVEQTEVFWGRGNRVGKGIVRVTWSFLVQDRRYGPSRIEPGAPSAFEGVEENLDTRRLAGELQAWRPRFVEKRGVERLDGIEDVDLGSSLRFRAGVSPEFLGGTTDEGYLAARWDAGVGTERFGFGTASLDVSSRLRHDPRELIAQANARWTNQSLPQQTFVIAAHGSVGHRVYRDYQVIVGGLNGLRAYPVRALAGQQLWRFNAEHRWPVASRLYQLVSIGAAAFYDAARTWGPGAEGVPWHHDVGLGMRLSLPHSRLARVARFDVAWPISPTRDGRRVPVFSFGSGQAF